MQVQCGAENVRFASRITKARIQTHTQYVIVMLFHGNNGYANAPKCYLYTYIAPLVSLKVCAESIHSTDS